MLHIQLIPQNIYLSPVVATAAVHSGVVVLLLLVHFFAVAPVLGFVYGSCFVMYSHGT